MNRNSLITIVVAGVSLVSGIILLILAIRSAMS